MKLDCRYILGLEVTFEQFSKYSKNASSNDCTHTNEKGCAILEAVESGEIDSDSYANFRKMEKEKAYFESSTLERKKKDKDFGKMVKSFKKQRKNDKY